MSDIFVDGVRSVAVANGVVRVELLQLKRDAEGAKLEPSVVGTLLLPVAGLRDFAAHLSNSARKIEASEKARAQAGSTKAGDVDTALENL